MDFTNIIENNLVDHLVVSNYDKESFTNDVELCLGIDEAGRGPVLGPMVYAALFCPIDKEAQLKEMECADSKVLSEKDREKIFKKINEENKFCGYAFKVLSPHTISQSMLRKIKYNLNELSHDTAMCLIDKLYNQEKLNITHVYLDTVGDPTKYELKLSKRFPKLKIKVSKKADSLFPCVSAASICAKVTRDSVLKNWIFLENCQVKDFGSGYPGDPVTKRFLDATIDPVFGFVKLVRFSWSTAFNKVKKSCVAIEWSDKMDEGEFEEDEEEENGEGEDGTSETKTRSKTTKKAASKQPSKPSKLESAVKSGNEKNNSSILSFFQKSAQKRPLNTNSSSNGQSVPEIISHFMTSRKLKLCKNF